MTAYIVGHLTVRNTDWQKDYQARLPEIVARHGGKLTAGAPQHFEGDGAMPDRVVVFEFPTMEAARAWYADPDHAPLVELRQTGADLFLLGIETPAA